MNYIQLINQFWLYRRSRKITSTQADLYYFLVQECNQQGWKNPFTCSNVLICASIGVSEPSLIDARNRLKQYGLIDYQAGKRNEASPVYHLINLNNLSRNRGERLVNEGVNSEEKAEHYNKQNKTKHSFTDANASVPLSEEGGNFEEGLEGDDVAPRPKTEYQQCIASYNEFCKKETGNGAKIDKAEGDAMKKIIKYLHTQVRTKQPNLTDEELKPETVKSWSLILDNWDYCKGWLNGQIRLRDINSQLQNILKSIKDGIGKEKSNGTNPAGTNQAGPATRTARNRGGSVDDLQALKSNRGADADTGAEFAPIEVVQ